MRGVYRLGGTAVSVAVTKTLVFLRAPATGVIEILSARITCENEDTSEQFIGELNRTDGSAAGTSTAEVAKPTEELSAASVVTLGSIDYTVEPTVYDHLTDAIARGGANKLGGWEYVPLPEERPVLAPSDRVGLRIIGPFTAAIFTGEIIYREIG